MKKILLIGAISLAVLLAIGALINFAMSNNNTYEISMENNDGDVTGTIKLIETRAGVLLDMELAGLAPNGEHAFHVHEKADCSPQGTFTNAGGHYNPFEAAHGMKHPEGHHAGDMPNIRPDAEGNILAKVLNTKVTLSDTASKNGRAPLFDDDGSSIVIHAGADDHMSQPSGAAGARIMCGEITQE